MNGKIPDTCPICNDHVGRSYDVHMVLEHTAPPTFKPSTKQKKNATKKNPNST